MEKKHREKIRNTGKPQGKHREFYLGSNVATLKTLHSNYVNFEGQMSASVYGWMFIMLPFFVNLGPFTVPVDEEVEAQHMKFIMAPPG